MAVLRLQFFVFEGERRARTWMRHRLGHEDQAFPGIAEFIFRLLFAQGWQCSILVNKASSISNRYRFDCLYWALAYFGPHHCIR